MRSRSMGRQATPFAALCGLLALVAAVVYGSAPAAEKVTSADFATLAGTVLAQQGSADYFLKVDGIEGESTDVRHSGEIDVSSWSWGVSNGATNGSSAGKPVFTNVELTSSFTGKAGPPLMQAAAAGKMIKEAVLTASRGGDNPQDFLIVRLSDVIVSSYQTSADGGVPSDRVDLSFSKIVLEYRPQNPDGTLGAPVSAGWDLKSGKPA